MVTIKELEQFARWLGHASHPANTRAALRGCGGRFVIAIP
jgi:hypothetical protein